MMDIESQFEALKASWVVKLINSNESWGFFRKYISEFT